MDASTYVGKEAVTVTEIQERKRIAISDNVRLASHGDAAAFSRLVLDNEGMLYRVCRAILPSEADCADAVQETIIMAWQRIGQLRNGESFPAWAARICINRCYRIARRHRQPGSLAEPEPQQIHNDTKLDVLSAVSTLPEGIRLTVVFYYFEDWSVQKIAQTLGIFQGTVKSRLHRARQLLAETLTNYKEGNRYDA